jgi:hypothetical protein
MGVVIGKCVGVSKILNIEQGSSKASKGKTQFSVLNSLILIKASISS